MNPDIALLSTRVNQIPHTKDEKSKNKPFHTHIKIMLSVIKSQIERHVGVIDVNIHKLHHIVVRNFPQQLKPSIKKLLFYSFD